MIPGSNILAQALSLIAAQAITYIAFASRTANTVGQWVNTYSTPTTVYGSIQPVPRTLMEILGLDMSKHYVNIFVPQTVVGVRRDVSSDLFQYANATYQAISLTKWFSVDGWNQVLAVEIPYPANILIAGEDGVIVAGENKMEVAGDGNA